MERSHRIDSLKAMLEKEPEDLFLNFALGLEYANEAQGYQLAEQHFNYVLALNENYLAAYYQLGKLLEVRNLKPEAIHFYSLGLQKAKEQKNNKAVNEFSEALFMLED